MPPWLEGYDPEALALTPVVRVSKVRVKAYLDHLDRAGSSAGTQINRLQELDKVAGIMGTGHDGRYIRKCVSMLRSRFPC